MIRWRAIERVVGCLLVASSAGCGAVTGLDDLIFDLSDDSGGAEPVIDGDECASEAGTDPDGVCDGGVCDGHGRCATGELSWSAIYSGEQRVTAHAVAVTDERVVVAGQFHGEVDFGDTAPFGGGSGSAWFVVSDVDGGYLRGGSFGDQTTTGSADAKALAFDRDGALVMAGEFSQSLTMEPAALTAIAGTDLFVVRFAEGDGSVLWSKRLGSGDGDDVLEAMAVDSNGHVVIGGTSDSTTINFGGEAIPKLGTASQVDAYVAKIDRSDGSELWSRRFGTTAVLSSLAVDANDNVVIVGTSWEEIDFAGAGNGVAPGMFVAKLDPSGEHLWSKSLGGDVQSRLISVAIGSNDAVIVAGWFDAEISLGTVALEPASAAGSLLVAQWNADGQLDWPRKFDLMDLPYHVTSSDGSPIEHVAVDSTGNVVIVGSCAGQLSFEPDHLLDCGSSSGFIAKLGGDDGDGPEHLWSHSFDGLVSEVDAYRALASVAVSPGGAIYAAGDFGPDISIAGDNHVTPGLAADALALKLDP